MNAVNPIEIDLPTTGFMRLDQVLVVLSIGKTTWYKWIGEGKAPEPIYLTPRSPRWRVRDIRELIQRLEQNNQQCG